MVAFYKEVCIIYGAEHPLHILWLYNFISGLVAQLGERSVRIREVVGSNPIRSTIRSTVILIELRWIFSVASFRRACGNRRMHGAEMEIAAADFMVPLPAARQVSCATYRTALFSRQPNRRRRCVIGRTASGGYFFANLIRQRSDCCPTSSCGPPADPRRCPGYTDDAPPAYPASSAPDTPPGCPTGAADGPYR